MDPHKCQVIFEVQTGAFPALAKLHLHKNRSSTDQNSKLSHKNHKTTIRLTAKKTGFLSTQFESATKSHPEETKISMNLQFSSIVLSIFTNDRPDIKIKFICPLSPRKQ